VAAAAVMRASHRAAMVTAAPATALRSLSREVHDTYLRAFVGHEQDNWVGLLPMAEFAYNNSITMGNGMSPFYANYGFHPVSSDPAATGPLNPTSKLYAHWMHVVHKASAERLEAAHERMRRYTDPQRTKPPEYQIGDLVMLNGCNIKTCRPSRKLDHKNHSPFQVEKIVSPLAVRLTLPWKWKIHNVFHVSNLNPTEPANTGHRRTPRRSSGRPTTSNKARNTTLTRSLGAPGKGAASCTSSNGSTTQTRRTGHKNHTITFR